MEKTLENRISCAEHPEASHPYRSQVTAAYRRTFSWMGVVRDGWKDLILWLGRLLRRDQFAGKPGFASPAGNPRELEEIRSRAYLDIQRIIR